MALVLFLEKRKLNRKVKDIFIREENGGTNIIIPAMVLAEIGYLAKKKIKIKAYKKTVFQK